MADILWTPPQDVSDLLMLEIEGNDDSEFNRMMIANQASMDWLAGRIDAATYFEILDSCQVDPYEFITPAQEYMQRVVR